MVHYLILKRGSVDDMRTKWIQIGCIGIAMMSVVLSACGSSGKYDEMELTSDEKVVVCFDTEVYERDGFSAVQEFGLSLLKEQLEESNPVISPASAYIALAMTGDGAEGNTRQEFLDLLGKDGEMTLLSSMMMKRLPAQEKGLQVELADSIWIDDQFKVKEEWLSKVESVYEAQVFQTMLETDETMFAINDWVSHQTKDLIAEMVEQPFNSDTRLVLLNAVYFDGMWQEEFEAKDTREEYFYIATDEATKMPMMNQYGINYEYIETSELEGCVLPYQDGNYAFVALIPKDEQQKVEDCIKALNAKKMTELLANRKSCLMDLKLPKFEVEYGKKLNDVLKNIGLIDAFDGQKADFSSMGKSKDGMPVCIGEVVQKSVIRVDEKGTEAAAATEVVMVEECAMEPIEEVKKLYFNRPFFYMIMEMKYQIPVFMGVMDHP